MICLKACLKSHFRLSREGQIVNSHAIHRVAINNRPFRGLFRPALRRLKITFR
jgi:hypothetical protein